MSFDPSRLSPDPRLTDRDVEAPISKLEDFVELLQLGDHDGIRTFLAERRGAFGFAKRVMVKVATSHLRDGSDMTLRLVDEARLGMRLNHPNLLQTLDLGRDGERFFLVREWVDGIGLRALMSRVWAAGDRFPVPAVLRIAIRVGRALGYLHVLRSPPWAPRGIVHGGVAPSNVLVSKAGETRLANLFSAAPAGRPDEQADLHGRPRRIPAFTAPEVMAGAAPGPRADVFGLGAVLFECLVGPDAFAGDPASDWSREPDAERASRMLDEAPLGDDLREVVVRALAPDPSRRYATAEALGGDLRRILRDEHRSDGDEDLRALLARHL